jgi:hypothetical protein
MPFIHAPAFMSDEADGFDSSFDFSFGADAAGADLADEASDNPGAVRPSGPSNESPFLTVMPSVGKERSTSPLYS